MGDTFSDGMRNSSTVLIGLQYGDEGKARVIDKKIVDADVIVRFNGGANAGHTLKVGNQEIVLHQVPSGIFHPNKLLYIGSGCVLDPIALQEEIKAIEALGISLKNRLFISGKVSLVQPHHRILDGLWGKEIGTTKRGIGPAYADQAIRMQGKQLKNVRFAEYYVKSDIKDVLLQNIHDVVTTHAVLTDNPETLVAEFTQAMQSIEQYRLPHPLYMHQLADRGKRFFFEGAQAVMLDRIVGVGPYHTASNTRAAAALLGGDLSLRFQGKILGVAKALMSRVGNGPFISEFGGKKSELYCGEGGGSVHVKEQELAAYSAEELLHSDDLFQIGVGLRMLSNEYGATTKRPRRLGMLDLVMLKHNCAQNAVDELYLTKVDLLTCFSKTKLPGIPLVVGYILDGKYIDYLPETAEEHYRAEPVIVYTAFLKEDISQLRDAAQLPKELKNYLAIVENYVGVPVCGIGVGPEREQFISLRD